MNIVTVDINKINLNPSNPRVIRDDKFKKLVKSITEFPEMLEVRPIVVDDHMIVLGGNMRLKACIQAGLTQVPIIKFNDLTEAKKQEFIVKDNIGYGEWDWEVLTEDYDKEELLDWGLEVPKTKHQFEEEIKTRLADRFIVPPFTVLDTRQGDWQARAKDWKALICETGESREGKLGPINDSKKNIWNDFHKGSGVSLLNPVLCEVVCHWFATEKAKIIDPFAGDTVFGYVSSFLGHTFTGIEIRPEQVELNKLKEIPNATFICDDGQNVDKHIEPESQDLIFSCPPYYDLEVYSDIENDASNQGTYEDFIQILDVAFTKAIQGLKNNRFAVIVAGDIRTKEGYYYNFHEDIKFIFNKAGMVLYNEMILVEPIGIAAMRANKNMVNRKVTKTHQNVLVFFKGEELPQLESIYRKVFVFYKGDIKEIKKEFKTISYNNIDVEDNIN